MTTKRRKTVRAIILAIVPLLCLLAAQVRAEDNFSIYGIDFSQNMEQVLENLLEREFTVSSTFVPIHLKEYVKKNTHTVNFLTELSGSRSYEYFPWSFPGINLPEEQRQLVTPSNERALMSYDMGKFKLNEVTASKRFSNAYGDEAGINAIFYTDTDGTQSLMLIILNGDSIQKIIIEEFEKRYGKPRKLKIGDFFDFTVWKVNDVRIACQMKNRFVLYAYKPELIEQYISFCATEIEKIIQAQNEARRQKAGEAAERRKNIF